MNPLRTWAVSRKEFIHVLRDPRSLGMAIAIPMLMLILFGYALTLDVDRVPMVVWDQSGTHTSRELVSRFGGSRYFTIAGGVSGYEGLAPGIDTPRVGFNSDMEARNYIVPGLIAVIMMVISALLTSLTVAREWEQGTMEQL